MPTGTLRGALIVEEHGLIAFIAAREDIGGIKVRNQDIGAQDAAKIHWRNSH